MPIGIIASLVICTLLYCAVALVVTGMVPYQDLDPAAALANAFVFHGADLDGDARSRRAPSPASRPSC